MRLVVSWVKGISIADFSRLEDRAQVFWKIAQKDSTYDAPSELDEDDVCGVEAQARTQARNLFET